MTTRPFMNLRPRRPSLSRTSSTGSSKSQERPASQDSHSEGYFNFAVSASPSPSRCTPPANFVQVHQQPPQSQQSQSQQKQLLVDSPRLGRSRPIAIELPNRKSSVAHTPPPNDPLSARGDLQGGYFPLHEDFKRSYKTHPFNAHLEPPFGKPHKSRSDSSISETTSPLYSSGTTNYQNPPSTDIPRFTPTMDALTLTMSMPTGKYHPSNFKNKNNSSNLTSGSNSAVTTPNPLQRNHTRKPSDIQRKLHQYQRDMVEQAAISARMKVPGGMSKPTSPRLAPLGSPGPVTPWELETGEGGYFGGGLAGKLGDGQGGSLEKVENVQDVGRLIGEEVEKTRGIEA